MTDLKVIEQPGDLIGLARTRAREWMKATGRSEGDLATGTKYSRATINQFLNNKYEAGDQTSVAREILRFLDRDARTEELKVQLAPVETPTYLAVQAALDVAKYTKRIAIIYGAPGVGKTFAAASYAAADPKNDIVVMTRFGMGHPKGFCAELRKILRGDDHAHFQYAARMSGDIIDDLKRNPRFLIINDAHRLRFPIFELACDIVEQARCGIAFIGHECMRDELFKLQRKDHEVYDRVLDFSNVCRVTHYQTGEFKKKSHADADQIRAVAEQLLPDVTDDAVDMLADKAMCTSMRLVVAVCQTASSIRVRAGKRKDLPADARLIRTAYKMCRPQEE